jgi:hypothetical protein
MRGMAGPPKSLNVPSASDWAVYWLVSDGHCPRGLGSPCCMISSGLSHVDDCGVMLVASVGSVVEKEPQVLLVRDLGTGGVLR